MNFSRNRCSIPPLCTSPTSSPTSSTPSYALPPTPTTHYSSTFVDVAGRQSGKKKPSMLANARLPVADNESSPSPDCLDNSSPLAPEPIDIPVYPSQEAAASKPTKTLTPGPFSRLRDRFSFVRWSKARQVAKSVEAAPPKPSSSVSAGSSSTFHRPQKNESRCLQLVMPGFYIAFEDDQVAFGSSPEDEELRTYDNQQFTHIIRLTKMTTISHIPGVKYTVDRNKTKKLVLSIFPHSHVSFEMCMRILSSADGDCDDLPPELARALQDVYDDVNDPSEGVTLLTARQLLAARNFLYASGYDVERRNGARILITAPRDHRTDVISALVCYLAYASGGHALTIIEEIEKLWSILGVWKGAVSKEGAEVIQEIVSI